MELNKLINQFNTDYNLGSLNLNKYYCGRTKFQLENFVQNEHDTPERKFLQLIMELKSLRDGYIIDSLEMEKLKLQIEKLLSTGDPIDKVEAMKKQYTLATMHESMEYRNREAGNICDLLKKLPKNYTYEEIENAEKGYWERRLTRQCIEDMASRTTGVNPGNIRAIIQSNCKVGEKFLELQNLLLEDFKEAEIKRLGYQ